MSCGRAYFPIELNTVSRQERNKLQEKITVQILPMTNKNISNANNTAYKRRVIIAGNMSKPAQVITPKQALVENFPNQNNPGPYKIGPGDVLEMSEVLLDPNSNMESKFITRRLRVSDDGYLKLYGMAPILAAGLSQTGLEEQIYKKSIEIGKNPNYELAIVNFNSQKIFVSGDNIAPVSLPYTNIPSLWKMSYQESKPIGSDIKIQISRGKYKYTISLVYSTR